MTTAEQIAHFERMAQTHFTSAMNAARDLPKRTANGNLGSTAVRSILADLDACVLNAWRLRHGMEPIIG